MTDLAATIDHLNIDASWRPPVPARFVIDGGGIVLLPRPILTAGIGPSRKRRLSCCARSSRAEEN